MEFRQLAALEAVLETGSFAAAARQRHTAQPALWAQVKKLELELGVQFFERQGRGVRPTQGVVALRVCVQRVLDDLRALAATAAEVRAGRALPARLGCGAYSVPHFLAPCFEQLRREDPTAPLPMLVSVTSSTGAQMLERGDLDLVVLPHLHEVSFPGEALYRIGIAVAGPGITRAPIDVARLHEQDIATMPADTGVGMVLREVCARAKVRPRIVYESRDASSLLAYAERGLALAVLVSEGVPSAARRRVGQLTARGRNLETDLWLHWRQEETLSPTARRLRDVLVAEARRRAPRPSRLQRNWMADLLG